MPFGAMILLATVAAAALQAAAAFAASMGRMDLAVTGADRAFLSGTTAALTALFALVLVGLPFGLAVAKAILDARDRRSVAPVDTRFL